MLSLGSCTAVLALEKNSEKSGRCLCATARTVQSFQASFSTPRCLSIQVRRGSCGWKSEWNERHDFQSSSSKDVSGGSLQGCAGSDDGPTSGGCVLTTSLTTRHF